MFFFLKTLIYIFSLSQKQKFTVKKNEFGVFPKDYLFTPG
jgi:hypothetical protein